MASLWLEVDDQGRILRRSEEVARRFAELSPPVVDLVRVVEQRTDLRAAIGRRAGHLRLGLDRGAKRVTFDVDVRPGAVGAHLRLVEVEPLASEAEVGRLLLQHTARHPDGLVVTDPDGIILWCDTSFAWIIGRERGEIIGRPHRIFRSPKVRQHEVESYWRALFAMGTYTGETLLRRSDGVDVPVLHAVSGIVDEQGRTTHFVTMVRDVSRERELERIRGIDVAVGLLSRVGGDQAHQLNDLAAEIVAVCDQAMLSDDPASAGHALDRVSGIATRLGVLGRQMLALSVSGNGVGPADMGKVARDLAELLRRAGGPEAPTIHVSTPEEGPWVSCSPDGLVRACIHLALRSLDGVAPGSTVGIAALDDYDEGLLRIRYRPTSAERAALKWLLPDGAVTGPMVNEFFARAYGAGVSLALEEETDGAISICVRAPLAEVVPSGLPAAKASPPASWRRAIVADHNQSLRELIAVSLESLFTEVVQARDAADARDQLERLEDGAELLVLDLRLPNGTGYDVLTEVTRRWPHLRVLVVTGAGPEGVARSALAAGARAVLPKPFRLQELRAVVRSVMAGAEW